MEQVSCKIEVKSAVGFVITLTLIKLLAVGAQTVNLDCILRSLRTTSSHAFWLEIQLLTMNIVIGGPHAAEGSNDNVQHVHISSSSMPFIITQLVATTPCALTLLTQGASD